MTVIAYIGIGANLGAAADTVRHAIRQMAALPGTSLQQSSALYSSTPVDAGGDDYVNAVAALKTDMAPEALLSALQTLELAHGRERPYRNAPRTLDLDLLLYADQTIQTPLLSVPHPRMTQRAFVLLPLLEIAPDIRIPGHGEARQYLPTVSGQGIFRLAEQ
ncbi:2-amino-4-hydroxy-6-hydroxymethyldihydropteridine diphosphokinase [Undibacterium griseum]|uniref:2-amino-4-hydroxy-6-hydroxymethyldihydropteridine pyrophosphokinase n=1 Tax=Undibacterium griseum TaxID=2762295 RepID=A0ABR6YK67_9BURK|nr:2-amino-4-hydroxy-6-hydroxymethyldihydropteridine diphosphokinase [Undibacterium griseum]MBC3884301.1 2-amino-4-hydroxy-6-hydroxymethyldihydropteridine diphosphokinase [Undibacterium griseum]